MKKRSLTLAGHRTSIAMEPEFWEAVQEVAAAQGMSVNQFIAKVDEERTNNNLSSAVRMAVLDWYRKRRKR